MATSQQKSAQTQAASDITGKMQAQASPNLAIIFNVRDEDAVAGWLGLDRKTLDLLDKVGLSVKSEFEAAAQKSIGFYLDECFADKTLKDHISQGTLAPEVGVNGLHESMMMEIPAALTGLSEKLKSHAGDGDLAGKAGGSGSEAEELQKALGCSAADAGTKLKEQLEGWSEGIKHQAENIKVEFEALKTAVHDGLSSVHGQVTAVEGKDVTGTDDDGAKWAFKVWPVDKDGSRVHRDDEDHSHFVVEKDSEVSVTPEGKPEQKTKIPEDFKVDDENNVKPAIDGMLAKWSADFWYGAGGTGHTVDHNNVPDSHKEGGPGYKKVEHTDDKGYKWSFGARAVDKGGEKWVMPNAKTFDHWEIGQFDDVEITSPTGDTRKVALEEAVKLDPEDGAGAVATLFDNGGADRWHGSGDGSSGSGSGGDQSGTQQPAGQPEGPTAEDVAKAQQQADIQAAEQVVRDAIGKLHGTAKDLRQTLPPLLQAAGAQRPVVMKQTSDWGGYITSLGALSGGDLKAETVRAQVNKSTELVNAATGAKVDSGTFNGLLDNGQAVLDALDKLEEVRAKVGA